MVMRPLNILITLFITLSLLSLVGQAQAALNDPLTMIELDTPVHFLAPDGSDLLIEAGTYAVEPAEEWIRVMSGERHDAMLLEATQSTHEVELEHALAMSVSGKSDDQVDSHFLILLLPGGKSLEANGTYSGIRSRATRRLSSVGHLAALKAAQARAQREQVPIAQPLMKSQNLPPTIGNYYPRGKIMVGQVITFEGSNLRLEDFIAQLGQTRPIILPLQERGATSQRIKVVVPATAVTTGSPLIVRYQGGQLTTLESNYRVFPRPTVTGMRILEGPWIGVPSRIELTISNFQGLEGQPVNLKSSECWTLGTRGPKFPSRGGTANVVFPVTFRPGGDVASLPGSTTTERLVALSNKTCPLELSMSQPVSVSLPTGKTVKLPRVWTKTISKTWDLTTHTTPSGKKFRADATIPLGICGPLSVGTAGSFPVGIVKYNNDVSFQLRNGLINSSCRFETKPRLKLRPGWVLTDVDWKIEKDTYCYPGIIHTEFNPGQWGYDPPLNPKYLDRIRVEATCVVASNDRANNKHLFRGTLREVTLVGPYGQPWTMAFE